MRNVERYIGMVEDQSMPTKRPLLSIQQQGTPFAKKGTVIQKPDFQCAMKNALIDIS